MLEVVINTDGHFETRAWGRVYGGACRRGGQGALGPPRALAASLHQHNSPEDVELRAHIWLFRNKRAGLDSFRFKLELENEESLDNAIFCLLPAQAFLEFEMVRLLLDVH